MAQVLPANVRPVVWLKRRAVKAGTFYNPRIKSSEVRSVVIDTATAFDAHIAILLQESKNAAKKARFARR
jgi:hypothetical protein